LISKLLQPGPGIKEMAQHADLGIRYVKSNHRITGKKDYRGNDADEGTAPIWGRYSMLE
jgi:hypothetical protein